MLGNYKSIHKIITSPLENYTKLIIKILSPGYICTLGQNTHLSIADRASVGGGFGCIIETIVSTPSLHGDTNSNYRDSIQIDRIEYQDEARSTMMVLIILQMVKLPTGGELEVDDFIVNEIISNKRMKTCKV